MKYLIPHTGEVWDSDTGQITKVTSGQLKKTERSEQSTISVEPTPEPQANRGFLEGASSVEIIYYITLLSFVLIVTGTFIYQLLKYPDEILRAIRDLFKIIFGFIGKVLAFAVLISVAYVILHFIIEYL